MTKAPRNKVVYAADIYRDADEDAAVESRFLGYFPSFQSALFAVRAAQGGAWATGGITYGFLWPGVSGIRPEHFETDEREASWFVGTDGQADR